MTDERCPFCDPPAERIFHQGRLVTGLWDAFPVSPGHALLVPGRHVPTWFDATSEEQADLVRAIALAKHAIEKSHRPDGYNVGVNIGEAAGQTVSHLHVHVIPRYRGDVPSPRGGVRHVIPGRGDYGPHLTALSEWPDLPHTRALVRGLDDPFLPHLVGHLSRATAVDIAVAFTMFGGVLEIFPHLQDVLQRGGQLRYLTGDYLGSTEPSALRKLLDLEATDRGAVQCRVFEVGPGAQTFHPKAFIIRRSGGGGVAFVGSSNVSRAALGANVEWNYRVVSSHDAAAFVQVSQAFEALFAHPSTRELTHEWVDDYARRRATVVAAPRPDEPAETGPEPPDVVVPHSIQAVALAALEATRNDGNRAGLVVLATGLGKTWLAALDSRRPEFRRVLFVAHREEILRQATATFRRIRPESSFGHYAGTERQPDADVLFASIQGSSAESVGEIRLR